MSRPTSGGPESRNVTVTTILWRGVTIQISYEPDWLGMSTHDNWRNVAHLQIEAIAPERAPLPMTETGYRSHFTDPAIIAEAGGPEAFAQAWLEADAARPEWKKREAAARQLSLF